MSTLDPVDLVAAIEDGLARSVRYFRRMARDVAAGLDLTYPQYNGMRELQIQGELRMSELAAALDLTNGATTGLVERLQARGLVQRTVARDDGRGVLVGITPEGSRHVDEVRQAVQRAIDGALARMSVPERHMAVGGIQALALALDEPR